MDGSDLQTGQAIRHAGDDCRPESFKLWTPAEASGGKQERASGDGSH